MGLEEDTISFKIADNKFSIYTELLEENQYQTDNVSRLTMLGYFNLVVWGEAAGGGVYD